MNTHVNVKWLFAGFMIITTVIVIIERDMFVSLFNVLSSLS